MFQTILITGGTSTRRNEQINTIISTIDTSPEYIIQAGEDISKSLKIQDIRNLKRKILLKPTGNNTIIVVLKELQRATIETQNAVLKLFEEPPKYVQIIATVDSKEKLLPTIISRSEIIKLSRKHTETIDKEQTEFTNLLMSDIGTLLNKASEIATDKKNIRNWLKHTIFKARTALFAKLQITNYDLQNEQLNNMTITQLITIIKMLSRALRSIETTNANPRLLIENLLISLHQSAKKA